MIKRRMATAEGGQPTTKRSTKHASLVTQKANAVAQSDGMTSQGTRKLGKHRQDKEQQTSGSRLAMAAGSYFQRPLGNELGWRRNTAPAHRRASCAIGHYLAEFHSHVNTNNNCRHACLNHQHRHHDRSAGCRTANRTYTDAV